MQKFPICLEYENTLFFTWEWKSGCPHGVFCPSPSPPNTYSYVGKENLDSAKKIIQNYLNWRTKYLDTSTTIRKILVPNKLLSSIHKYVNTYSYVEKENSDSTRKFVRNYLNWHTKYLNTSTTIRKILVQKKLLSSIRKYVKPKSISRQNQKLTQQHNWKKSSSSPCKASVCVFLSVILSVRVKRGM